MQLQEESHGPCITQADPDECTQPTYDDAVVNDDTSVNDSIDNDIVGAILKAFGLAEQMGASQKQFMDIIAFGRDLYCKGNGDMMSR